MVKPIEGFEAYNDSAMAYNKQIDPTENLKNKLLTKDDLLQSTKSIDNTTIYNTVKKVSTLPIGKTLTALDITNTCNVIVDDWVKNGTLTEESGKKVTGFFATNIGIKAVAYCTVALYGTSSIKIQTKEDQMKTALKCAAIVMLVSSLVDIGIEKSVDSLVDFIVSEDTNQFLQETAENNWNAYKQEQEKILIIKEKQKTKEEEFEKLKEIGRKQVMKYRDSKLNEIEKKMQEKGKENYKNMSKENKDQIEYYYNYMQGILNN